MLLLRVKESGAALEKCALLGREAPVVLLRCRGWSIREANVLPDDAVSVRACEAAVFFISCAVDGLALLCRLIGLAIGLMGELYNSEGLTPVVAGCTGAADAGLACIGWMEKLSIAGVSKLTCCTWLDCGGGGDQGLNWP